MKKYAVAGAAVAALVAIPVLAQQATPRAPAPTRAAVQAGIKAEFAKVDSNKDGFVTEAEAKANADAARAQRQTQRAEGRAELFARLDANHDGSISRAEFDSPAAASPAARAERPGRGAGMLGLLFAPGRLQAMDGNKDGKVSLAEASANALAMFDRVDANRDGTISAEEGRAARTAVRAPRQQRTAAKTNL